MPAGDVGSDAHLTIVQPDGWEYDLWAVKVDRVAPGGGSIPFINGGKCRIDGDGTGSYAVAARTGSLGGLVMTEELLMGKINHALQMFVPYTKGYVAPAIHAGDEEAPSVIPMGAHFRLHMSLAAIAESGASPWRQAVLRALHTYGAYAVDTTGDPSYWGFRFESTASWLTDVGDAPGNASADPRVPWARALGVTPDDYNHNGWPEYWLEPPLTRAEARKLVMTGTP
jgi:hypothetical protein